MQKNNFGHTNLAGKKHNKRAVQEAAQQRLALDKGQKIDNKSQKVNENKLDLDKENVDQLNQEEEKGFKCIFCGETVGKHNWQTHIETIHAEKISQEKVGNLTTFPSISQLNQNKVNSSKVPPKCALCNKIICSPDNMKSHLEKVHGSKKPEDSEIKKTEEQIKMASNEMIGNGDNLKSHIETVHGNKKLEDSEIKKPEGKIINPNDEIINPGDNLISHIEKVHESKKPDNSGNGNFHCEICNVEVINGDKLDRHMNGKKHIEKVHENEKLATGSVMAN